MPVQRGTARLVHPETGVEYAFPPGAHRKAVEQLELAAQAHRDAAEHDKKRIVLWQTDTQSERWLENSDHAYKLAQEAPRLCE
jgi:hypothetical protein